MISGWGRSAGAVIPALGSGRYSPGPNIVLPSWRKGSVLNFTINVVWGQPGALATVSQNALVYINTLMLQQVLGEAAWATRLTVEDLRALTPLLYGHVSPYSHFLLDMQTR